MKNDLSCTTRCQHAISGMFDDFLEKARQAGWDDEAVAIAATDLALNNLKDRSARRAPPLRVVG